MVPDLLYSLYIVSYTSRQAEPDACKDMTTNYLLLCTRQTTQHDSRRANSSCSSVAGLRSPLSLSLQKQLICGESCARAYYIIVVTRCSGCVHPPHMRGLSRLCVDQLIASCWDHSVTRPAVLHRRFLILRLRHDNYSCSWELFKRWEFTSWIQQMYYRCVFPFQRSMI